MAVSTYDTNEMAVLWSANVVEELRQDSMWLQLMSQADTEPWANGDVKSVRIPVPNWAYAADADSDTTGNQPAGVRAVSRLRGGAWTAAISGRSSTLEFTRRAGSQTANEIDVEDSAELPWDVDSQTRSRQDYVLRRDVDTKLFNAWTSGIGSGAAEQVTLGAAADTISITGDYTGAGDAYEQIFRAFERFRILCKRRNVDSMESDSLGRKFAVLPIELVTGLERWMLDKDFHWDALTSQLLTEAQTNAMGMFQQRLKGIDIYCDNNVEVPTGSGNSDYWQFYMGVRPTWRANVRTLPGYTQVFEPAENQISDHPATLMRATIDIGWLEISSGDLAGLNQRYRIRTAA